MNMQSVLQALITALVTYTGYGTIFPRLVAELQRIDDTMPSATGAEKLAKFEADAKIIFDDGVLPIGTYIFHTLLNLGLVYLRGVNPTVGAIATAVETSMDTPAK